MHYKLEIILPKTETLEQDLETILNPFDENNEEADHAFFDWYVIGGRFAGGKLTAKLDSEKIDLFYKNLKSNKIMVSGFVSGKEEIETADQQETVDEIWRSMFPESGIDVCPFFKHSNDQYKETLPLDICGFIEVPLEYECNRIIIASPNYDNKLAPEFMISTDFWNGVTWIDTNWSGKFEDAIEMFKDKIKNYKESYKKNFDFDNFMSISIDYHS